MCRRLLPTPDARAAYDAALHQESTAARTGCPCAKAAACARRQKTANDWHLAAQADARAADALVADAPTETARFKARNEATAAHLVVQQAREAALTPAERAQEEAANGHYYATR